MLTTTIRLLGLGADPRKHSRRGKLPVFVAREHFRESCAMEIEKWELFVIKMIEHKTADPFYIALTVAGLESYYGILAIEVDCHDMRSFTDPVLMPHTRLSPSRFSGSGIATDNTNGEKQIIRADFKNYFQRQTRDVTIANYDDVWLLV